MIKIIEDYSNMNLPEGYVNIDISVLEEGDEVYIFDDSQYTTSLPHLPYKAVVDEAPGDYVCVDLRVGNKIQDFYEFQIGVKKNEST